MRTINMTVTGDLVEVDATVVGVQGSGNADTIRLTLDGAWDGYAKTATWWNGHGEEAASRTLTADLLEDIAISTRRYLLPVPAEALQFGGTCILVLDGYAEGVRSRTMTQEFSVASAPVRRAVAGNESVTTPTDMEQTQSQVDMMLGQLQTVVNGEAARVTAETDRQSAEAERVEAEKIRASNEDARMRDEKDRATAEVERSKAEIARGSAEYDRVGREQLRREAESDRKAAETMRRMAENARAQVEVQRQNAEAERAAAEAVRQSAIGGQVEQATQAAEAATEAAAAAQTVQAALSLATCIKAGVAEEVQDLPPGKWLLVTDSGSMDGVATWEGLVEEARKAGAEEENQLETMATLSAVQATNWRRTEEGSLWTNTTLGDFCAALTAFALAAGNAGYVGETGALIVTWAQVQHWILTEDLIDPLTAETMPWPWTQENAESEAWRGAIENRLQMLEAQFFGFAEQVMKAIEGAEP